MQKAGQPVEVLVHQNGRGLVQNVCTASCIVLVTSEQGKGPAKEATQLLCSSTNNFACIRVPLQSAINISVLTKCDEWVVYAWRKEKLQR